MKKFLKATVLILVAVITFSLSGCFSNEKYIVEEECRIVSGIDSHVYTYSDKLEVKMSPSSDYVDTLSIKWGTENVNDWYEILSGNFTTAAWYDYKHFVLLDNIYYEFDIKNYKLPKSLNEEFSYELKEYTQSEFAKAYSDYESFDWYQPYPSDINEVHDFAC